MSQLIRLQAGFQQFILDKNLGSDFVKSIVDDENVGANLRMNIYFNGYRLRIIEALAAAYPKLHAWLGDVEFDKIARSYIDQYPSTFCNMRWMGDKMPLHLAKCLPTYPFAAELAQFEWALGLAFDAEDTSVLLLNDLSNIAPEHWGELKFKLHSSVQLLPSKYNVIEIWKALDNDETPPKPRPVEGHVLIWRYKLDAHFRSIELLEYQAIEMVINGMSFANICENLTLESEEQASQLAAQYLLTWLNDEIIQAIN